MESRLSTFVDTEAEARLPFIHSVGTILDFFPYSLASRAPEYFAKHGVDILLPESGRLSSTTFLTGIDLVRT